MPETVELDSVKTILAVAPEKLSETLEVESVEKIVAPVPEKIAVTVG